MVKPDESNIRLFIKLLRQLDPSPFVHEPGVMGVGGNAVDSAGEMARTPAEGLGIMGQSTADGGRGSGVTALLETQPALRV